MESWLHTIGANADCSQLFCVAGSSTKTRQAAAGQLSNILQRFLPKREFIVVSLTPEQEIQMLMQSINIPIG
jgi:hypothetical protein